MIAQQLKDMKEHNQAMLEIPSVLSYVEFDDTKECDSAKKMWDKNKTIYWGDDNVLRVKSESLRGKIDEMRMMEGENIVQYYTRVKEVVNAIWGENGTIEDEIVISKVLTTLFPIYAIRVSTILELRFILGNNLTLEGVIGILTSSEMANFDNYTTATIESTFKS